jgi:hypothetical protein
MPAKTPEDKAFDAIKKHLASMDTTISGLGLLIGHAKDWWLQRRFAALVRVYARIWSIKYEHGDFVGEDQYNHAKVFHKISKILEAEYNDVW